MKKIASTLLIMTSIALTGCSGDTQTELETVVDDTYNEAMVEAGFDMTLDYDAGLAETGYFDGVTAGSHVSLSTYKGIDIPTDIHTVDADKLQAQIDEILKFYITTEKNVEKAIETGDTVNIDFVGSVDGVEFEGGSTSGIGTDVTIGTTQYIDDFLDQLIGHIPGDTVDVNVTFPEDYGKEELQGKDALFVVNINYIKSPVLPELTDTFVAGNLSGTRGWETVDDMTNALSKEEKEAAILSYIRQQLLKNASIDNMPETVLDYQQRVMTNYYVGGAINYHMTVEEFLSNYTEYTNMDEVISAKKEEVFESAKWAIIMQAIAEENDIIVTDEDIDAYFLDNISTVNYADVKEQFGIKYIRMMILQEEVADLLISEATLN